MEMSVDINELSTALAKAQGAMAGAKKDTKNEFFKSKYADLSSVWDACRQALSVNGLSVIQTTGNAPDHIVIETQLNHASGQWIRGSITMKPTKTDPQGILSCITYARRASLSAMVGVAPEDDDGNAASGNTDEKKQAQSESSEKWVEKIPLNGTPGDYKQWWSANKDTIKSECGEANASEVYKAVGVANKKANP
jgi:hypothetical protein